MRIVDLREISVPLSGAIANALVNFAEHTVSLVAVVSDVVRNGKPVTGVAFNSIGRFAQGGLLRERFIPRLLRAAPASLQDETGQAFSPARVVAAMMANEKPGGHGDRAAAVAPVELAIWDLSAKLADEPAWRTIARAFGQSVEARPVPVYAAGGLLLPAGLAGRPARRPRPAADGCGPELWSHRIRTLHRRDGATVTARCGCTLPWPQRPQPRWIS